MAFRVRRLGSRNFRESGSSGKWAVLLLGLSLVFILAVVLRGFMPKKTVEGDLSGVYQIHTRYTSSKSNQDGYLKTELQNNEGKIEKNEKGYLLSLNDAESLKVLSKYSLNVDGGEVSLEYSNKPTLSIDGLNYKISFNDGILLDGDDMDSSVGSLILSVYSSLAEEVEDVR